MWSGQEGQVCRKVGQWAGCLGTQVVVQALALVKLQDPTPSLSFCFLKWEMKGLVLYTQVT